MAGIVRRAMVYLGLVDDDYDEYEPYEEPAAPARPVRAYASEPEAGSTIRTIPSTGVTPVRDDQTAQINSGGITARPSVVRPIATVKAPTVHVVEPTGFKDGQEIADRFKAGQPVIVNLQGVRQDLSRRMVDFCSGMTYSLGGSMSKAAHNVFLLTPSNVEVSGEEKRKLEARGLYETDGEA